MLINGNSNISSKDKVPDVEVCNKTELMIRDGRNYTRFASELSRNIDSSANEQDSANEKEGKGGVDLLLQLL